jgi:hypothetical protein
MMEFTEDQSTINRPVFRYINDWNMLPDDKDLRLIQDDMVNAKAYLIHYLKLKVKIHGYEYCWRRANVTMQYLYLIVNDKFEPNIEKLFKLAISIDKGVKLYAETAPKKRGPKPRLTDPTGRKFSKNGKPLGRRNKVPVDVD